MHVLVQEEGRLKGLKAVAKQCNNDLDRLAITCVEFYNIASFYAPLYIDLRACKDTFHVEASCIWRFRSFCNCYIDGRVSCHIDGFAIAIAKARRSENEGQCIACKQDRCHMILLVDCLRARSLRCLEGEKKKWVIRSKQMHHRDQIARSRPVSM